MTVLKWTTTDEGILFACHEEGKPLVVEKWGKTPVVSETGESLSVGSLLVSLDNEEGTQPDACSVLVPWKCLALFEPYELKQLGFPQPSLFRLNITGSGVLLRPGFVFNFQFLHPNGQPVMGSTRNGSFLTVGGNRFCLLDPIFTLVEMMESFNALSPEDMEQRLLLWGKMKELLPEDVVVDDYLRGINVAPADAFTLEISDEGEANFNPILVKGREEDNLTEFAEGKARAFETLLPEVTQESFTSRFTDARRVMGRYALDGGWYVAIPPALKKALSVVKEMQSRPVEERRAFIANPRHALKQAMGEVEDSLLENLFYESPEFLSDRIKYLGVWEPKVGAFLFSTKQDWLGGPEELGLPIGNNCIVRVPVDEILELIEAIQKAKEANKLEVDYRGQKIPANDETIRALSASQPAVKPEEGDGQYKPEKETVPLKIVPIIKDNIVDDEFTRQVRRRNGSNQELPQGLRSELLPHQRQGLFWLQTNWIEGYSGVLLADDMGLGKTFQALAFLNWTKALMETGKWSRQPFLIVAPTGLLKNWEEEESKHLVSPGLGNLLRAYGAEFRPYKAMLVGRAAQEISKYDWVLTTYETLRDYIRIFIKIDWGVTFFDEVQKIKNPSAMMTDMAKSLQSEFTVALTGTPVENRLADLWCIVDTVQPGLLKDLKSFSRTYESEDGAILPESSAKLKKKLVDAPPRVMLRRLKEDHLEGLPAKNSQVIQKPMPEVQAAAYQKAVFEARSAGKKKGKMLSAIQKFRSISLHPYAYDVSMDGNEYVKDSARLEGAFEILDQIARKKEKALIFVESKQMQQWLVPYIQQRYELEYAPMVINGTVSGPKRQERVKIFQASDQNNFDVMILSPKAGGVGLTLTAANHVIHLSRWWNPAVEDQCTDRAFRIGQKKEVSVYYPMAIHPDISDVSFDSNLNRLLERKRSLSREVLAPPGGSSADVVDLFNETINEESVSSGGLKFGLPEIDLLEPLAFEDLVINQLHLNGYQAQRTPLSGDCGADVVVKGLLEAGEPSFVIQCKHTQTQNYCSESAVQEILNSLPAYRHISEQLIPLVVTNARGFTNRAIALSRAHGVRLIGRDEIVGWLQNPI
ncbi:Superfamily II DNA or RNA helicase, SNF2 family [Desulfuromusa kysingii]|uniref:Superfamily II DNA or RNA helicase, SNF2 family n=1 Tax=Desulfuromusa kysingii TaxID=37625 RepID=A0A1H4D6Q8_9BACT|nr:SNF2-related protein [Desulfuromusa kysingii]SEA68425.1 Superfamily II DNA or RNA helicase, SNF2 family [Desulfuromusa kysingii]